MIKNVIDISVQTLGFYDITLEGNVIDENSDHNYSKIIINISYDNENKHLYIANII